MNGERIGIITLGVHQNPNSRYFVNRFANFKANAPQERW